jgi:hypothetical protein
MQEKIEKETKELLEKFAHALEAVKVKPKALKTGAGGFREEGRGEVADDDFRARMFENAPRKKGDFILSEKKKWQ